MCRDGIDADSALKSRILKVLTKMEACLRDGYLDPDSIIRFLVCKNYLEFEEDITKRPDIKW